MKTFITSDLHLNHSNIIKYCNRPFDNVDQMNEHIVNNWNKTIRPHDRVYFVGDVSFQTEEWILKLNGNKTFIKGNHDRFKHTQHFDNLIIEWKGLHFYLVHDPENIPTFWKGWSICGHHHNNFPDRFPFFDVENKRFNVSVEMTNYEPVNIEYIYKLVRSRI